MVRTWLERVLDGWPGHRHGTAPDHDGDEPRPATQPGDVLFRSRDLIARARLGHSRGCCVVTFGSFTDDRTLDRPGFGERFLQSRGVDAIHVLSRDNDWYQYPETERAMASVRNVTVGYGRVVTYGSSMGGYAAVRLAGLVGADCALAFSPQFSILPSRAPFEHRWYEASRRLRPVWENRLPLPDLREGYIVHDPLDLDSEHAALFARASGFTPVRLRGAGHHTADFLQGTGLLEGAVLAACGGQLDVPGLMREAWARRRRSAQYYVALAESVRSPERSLGLIRSALSVAPNDPGLLSRLGLALARCGLFEEAVAVHRTALDLRTDHPPFLADLASTLEATGDLDGAISALERLTGTDAEASYRGPLRRLRSRRIGVREDGRHGHLRSGAGWSGFVLGGEDHKLREGRYAVEFAVSLEPGQRVTLADWRTACILDVCIHGGRTVVARKPISVRSLRAGAGRRSLVFELPHLAVCQFRLRTTGAAALIVRRDRVLQRLGGRASPG